MPRTTFPSPLLTLIQTTSYPPLPPRDDLDTLRQLLAEQRSTPSVVKRKREESIPIPIERPSPAVKLERSVSPAGSVISVSAPGPSNYTPPVKSSTPSVPITYGGIKKKKKKPFESDDDGECLVVIQETGGLMDQYEVLPLHRRIIRLLPLA